MAPAQYFFHKDKADPERRPGLFRPSHVSHVSHGSGPLQRPLDLAPATLAPTILWAQQ